MTSEQKQVNQQKQQTSDRGVLRRVSDLESEFGLDGRTIRAILRRNGLKAPKVRTSLGVRRMYFWYSNDKEYSRIRALLLDAKNHVEDVYEID